ncbi:acyl-CoA N-acyltransferase [Aspergillus cavernicola]|uniref:Acyl-CoA N-acyltransferase n=1 Tax=Aspergillus cavernicola TaxID=176166 RepID=A0ABR4I4T1_9EURO
MKIITRYATKFDIPTIAHINIQSFAGQGFISNAFPNISYDIVHPLKCARYAQKIAHPQTHVLTAEDADSGAVLGCTRWVFPSGNEEESPAAAAAETGVELSLPEGVNREIYDGFFEILKEKGKRYFREDDIVLEYLATDPKAQRKGVGKALLRWGMDKADQQQKRIYLEATTEGFPLYAAMGWKALDTVEIDYEQWGGKGKQELTLMIRDPLPSFNSSD